MPRCTARSLRWIAAGVTLATACGSPPAADRPAPPTRPWVVATAVDFGGVNELVAPNVRFTAEVHGLLFLGLVEEQPDFAAHPPSFAPALAERWELSADGREMTFHLRADARWSDGRPVTARDVEFTLRAQRAPEIAWPYADSKRVVTELRVLDERTVRFHLATPGPYRLVDVNDGHVLPEHAWGDIPFAEWRGAADRFRARLVTSGPYRLAAWRPGLELELEPNPSYSGPGPTPHRSVFFRVTPDPAALVERLLAGEFDFADGLSPLDAERVARAGGLRLLTSEARQYDCIAWNLRRPPFDDPEIRRALTLAIDRQQLVDALWRGRARVAVGPVPSYVWARDPELAPWPYAPDEARAILARRGFADRDGDGVVEREGEPFAFELTTNSTNRLRGDAAVMIQEQLRRIGVRATPRPLEINTLTELNLAGDFDATLMGWGIDTTLDFRPYFHSAETADGWNFIGYASAEVDRALDDVRAAPTALATREPLVRLQRLLHAEQPYTFLWEPPRLAAVRAGIEGAALTPLSGLASLPRWHAPSPAAGR
jgi:peptide/nickel transport system substrate-binding protein